MRKNLLKPKFKPESVTFMPPMNRQAFFLLKQPLRLLVNSTESCSTTTTSWSLLILNRKINKAIGNRFPVKSGPETFQVSRKPSVVLLIMPPTPALFTECKYIHFFFYYFIVINIILGDVFHDVTKKKQKKT